MTIFLVIVSLYGGIDRIPMDSEQTCQREAAKFNDTLSRVARGFCIRNAP